MAALVEVQVEVNRIFGRGGESAGGDSGGSSSSVGIDDLARRTINGDCGNGEERRQRLGSNHDAVQACVNEILL